MGVMCWHILDIHAGHKKSEYSHWVGNSFILLSCHPHTEPLDVYWNRILCVICFRIFHAHHANGVSEFFFHVLFCVYKGNRHEFYAVDPFVDTMYLQHKIPYESEKDQFDQIVLQAKAKKNSQRYSDDIWNLILSEIFFSLEANMTTFKCGSLGPIGHLPTSYLKGHKPLPEA